MKEKIEWFEFLLERVSEVSRENGYDEPQGFARWFAQMYFFDQFSKPSDFFVSDGSRDGKIDGFFSVHDGSQVTQVMLNTKFTEKFDQLAPPKFYDEIASLEKILHNKAKRDAYLSDAVTEELRPYYQKLFKSYDNGHGQVLFVTNSKKNSKYSNQLESEVIKLFHLDDLVQHLIDDIDVAMPLTSSMLLSGISSVLSPEKKDTEVSTSIVFARLIDFIRYMKDDPHGLLFARNVRVSLGNTSVNKTIRDTFEDQPKEFVFSNNGITMLCDKHRHDPGSKNLTLENPRVVNGAQTLHSLRDVANPSDSARIMVRIIEIPPITGSDLGPKIEKKKDIINKIAVRTNQQNPIKKWNLVANDQFQMEVYRFFRKRKLFYERRDREYKNRARLLKSVGIGKGPSIKSLTQAIASYHWRHPRLGPSIARKLDRLFETKDKGDNFSADKSYDQICQTPVELVFQIYLLDELIKRVWSDLSNKKKYIASLKGYIHRILFSLVVKSLQERKAPFGKKAFTDFLLEQRGRNVDLRPWQILVKGCIDSIIQHKKSEFSRIRREGGDELTMNNYVNSHLYMDRILKSTIKPDINKGARLVMRALTNRQVN